jgi:hypothetical protein
VVAWLAYDATDPSLTAGVVSSLVVVVVALVAVIGVSLVMSRTSRWRPRYLPGG